MQSKNKYRPILCQIFLIIFLSITISNCGIYRKTDARKVPVNAEERVKKNIEEGRGYRLFDSQRPGGGAFQFANSNGLWRASLDTIDFMPLSSVNYSGGIIITDWYSENNSPNESVKISIRFLTNEVRSDALDIKIFNRVCEDNSFNCKYVNSSDGLIAELKKEILKKATLYNQQDIEKNKKK